MKILVILFFSISFLSGCVGNETAESESGDEELGRVGAMEDYNVGITFKATEPLTFSLLNRDSPSYPINHDWLFFTHLEELTNVTFDTVDVPMSDFPERRGVLLAAGEAPLLIPRTEIGDETPFISSGAVLPVSDYIDYMPHFLDRVERWGLEDELDGIRQEDGKFYLLPGLHETLWLDRSIVYRADIFDQHQIAEPETWNEVLDAMRQLKQLYPDQYPMSERFTMNSLLNMAAPTFGVRAGWGLGDGMIFDRELGEYVFAPATDKYGEFLTFFNQLIEEELLDPESLTQDDDLAIQKFVSGQSFMISGSAQELVGYRENMTEVLGAGEFELNQMMFPGGPEGAVIAGSRLESGLLITAEAREREDFIALLQLVDWLYYSDEGQEFSRWGIVGETFVRNEEGKRELTERYDFMGLNPEGEVDLRLEHGFSNGIFLFGMSSELLESMMTEEALQFHRRLHETREALPIDPPRPMTILEQEEATMITTSLMDHVSTTTFEFILGRRPLTEFPAFVLGLEGMGLPRLLELVNEAYERFNDQH